VDTSEQKIAAERSVATLTGVTQVHNELTVRRPRADG